MIWIGEGAVVFFQNLSNSLMRDRLNVDLGKGDEVIDQ